MLVLVVDEPKAFGRAAAPQFGWIQAYRRPVQTVAFDPTFRSCRLWTPGLGGPTEVGQRDRPLSSTSGHVRFGSLAE